MQKIFRKILAFLFGLIFAGGGVYFFLMMGFPLLYSWYETRDWRPHQAMIISLESDSGKSAITYQYDFHNTIHRGERISLANFHDDIGSYHKQLDQKLAHFQRTGSPLPIWIDPQNPAQSVIDREMRWGLFAVVSLFCSVFFFIGLHVALSPFIEKTSKNTNTTGSTVQSLPQQRSPLTPWLERKEWQEARIRSKGKGGVLILWVISIAWIAISSPALLQLAEGVKQGDYIVLVALLFPVMGVFLLVKAIARTLQYRRFGTITCQLDPFPGSIGGNVGGFLLVNYQLDRSQKCEIELTCLRSSVSRHGKNRSRRNTIIWSESGEVHPHIGGTTVQIPFCFTIPEHLPPSDVKRSGDYHSWNLNLHADLPGIDLVRSFSIPVFPPAQLSRTSYPDLSRQMEDRMNSESNRVSIALERGDFEDAGLPGSVKIKKRDTDLILSHPPFRNLGITVFALIFGLGFSLATHSIITNFSSDGLFSAFSVLFAIPFGVVGLIGVVAALYLPLNSLKVNISRTGITTYRRLLFVPIYRRRIARSEILKCAVKKQGSKGRGKARREYFSIVVHGKDGVSVVISEGIIGKETAENFKNYLFRRIHGGY